MPQPLPKPTLLLAGCLALLCVAASTLRAENDPSGSVIKFFHDEQQRDQGRGGAATRPHPAPPPRSAPMLRAASPARPRPAAAARKKPAVTVAVYGDRLAQALAKGLDEDAGEWIAVAAPGGEEAGLTRADFTAWLETLRFRLGKPDRPKVAVLMVGSGDRQPIAEGDHAAEPWSAAWQTLYTARIDAVTAAFRDAHVPLVWVGLPSVHAEDATADFVRLNALFRDGAARGGATFVDSWEAFSDDAGNYSAIGPDVDGRSVKLRKADGFGFTRAGARKLASFVEADIKRLQAPASPGGTPATAITAAVPPTAATPAAPNEAGAVRLADITIDKARDFDAVLDIDVNAQIRREAGLAPEVDGPPKPAAGPVLSLTAPPATPGGELATAAVASVPPAPSLHATLAAKPATTVTIPPAGRADDFSWPKP